MAERRLLPQRMAAASLRRLALAFAISAVSPAFAGGDGAISLLERSMRRSIGLNVVTVITQRDPSGDGSYQRVKLEKSKDGRTRHTVLQPLRLQGVESIDDGVRTTVYLPDDRMIIDQPSPAQDERDVPFRMKLAQRNYKIRLDGRFSIAGRTAVRITATPVHDELLVRRYYLDQKTSYPLRLETVEPDGETTVYYDTKTIQYPSELDAQLFKMRPLPGLSRIRYERPETLSKNPIAIRQAMGFTPRLPSELPLGFTIQEVQNNQSKEWHSIAVRMTDGLVRATLYQWKSGGDAMNVKAYMNRTLREANGLRLLLVSDLGSSQREALMEAFVERGESAEPESWITGPVACIARPRTSEPRALPEALTSISRHDGTEETFSLPIGVLKH